MAYEPIPFVAPLIDQTSQRLKLADLLYQANMARSQAELQRQMQVAQMIAQFGQNIGAGIESWMDRQQKERLYNLQLERENRMMAAQEAQARAAARTLEFQKARELADVQREFFASMPEGVPVTGDIAEQTLRNLGPYGAQTRFTPALKSTPEMTDPSKFLMPEVTMETAPVGPEGGVAPTKQVSMAELAGVMAPERPVVREASLMKPMSIDTQKKMAEIEQSRSAAAGRNALNKAMQSGDPAAIQRAASNLMTIDPNFSAEDYYALTGKQRPSTSAQMIQLDTFAMEKFGVPFKDSTAEQQLAAMNAVSPVSYQTDMYGNIVPMPRRPQQISGQGQTGKPTIGTPPSPAAPPRQPLAGVSAPTPADQKPKVPDALPAFASLTFDALGKNAAPHMRSYNKYLGEGNYKLATNALVNATKELDNKNVDTAKGPATATSESLIGDLYDLRSQMATLKRNGIKTNLLTGKAEDIARALGTTTNPELAAMASNVARLNARVILALTGLTSRESEQSNYKKFLPDIGNTEVLNETLIDQYIRGMKTVEAAYWDSKVPGLSKLIEDQGLAYGRFGRDTTFGGRRTPSRRQP